MMHDNPTAPRWRPMWPADIDDVVAVAAVVHPGFPEAREVLAERLALHPDGCFMLEAPDGNALGYLLSHPWRAGTLPPLDTLLGELPEPATSYHLHDIALLPAARGTGAAGAIVAEVIAHARATGVASMCLVAVNGSQGYWARHGFLAEAGAELAEALASYGPGARYMVKVLA